MTGVLLSELAGLFNRPLIVVGGGMRALADLEVIPPDVRADAEAISANGHAFKIPGLKVRAIVCKDDVHTETKQSMQEILRPFKTPIITRQWWGDIRMADWPLQNNSGLDAIAVACMLTYGPVYPIGFDFYQEGTYWHDPEAPNVSKGRRMTSYKRRIETLVERFGRQVRPVSGPLVSAFAKAGTGPFDWQEHYAKTPTRHVRTLRPCTFPFEKRATIPENTVIPVSPGEAAVLIARKDAVMVDIPKLV